MGIRRHVQLSDEFLIVAEEMFPPEGSADGGAPFWLFEQTVLEVAKEAFGHDFERWANPKHPAIASFPTVPTPVVRKALRFYARLTNFDRDVELVDLCVEWDADELLEDPEKDD